MKRRVFSACLVFLLLFAQHGAIAHAISHAHATGSNQRGVECREGCSAEQPAQPDRAKLCAFDLAYCQVLGTAAGSFQGLPIASVSAQVVRQHDPMLPPARLIAPLSRGPPALL